MVIAFGLTWLLQFGLVAAGIPILSPMAIPAMLLAAMAPSMAAIVVTARSSGGVRAAVRELWGPAGAGSVGWLALALIARNAMVGAAALIVFALGGGGPLVAFYPLMIASALVASFGEELGWRGFAYRRLARASSPMLAALASSALWAMWHLPTAWFGGGASAVAFALFFVKATAFGMVICWLFERSGGRTLVAVIAHVGLNLTVVQRPDTALATVVTISLFVCAGAAAAAALGGVAARRAAYPSGHARATT